MRESLPAEKKKRENFFDGIAGDYKMKRKAAGSEAELEWRYVEMGAGSNAEQKEMDTG